MCFSLTAVTGWGLPGKGWTWGDKACGGRDEKEGEVGDGGGVGLLAGRKQEADEAV